MHLSATVGGWTKGGRYARIGSKPTPIGRAIIAIAGTGQWSQFPTSSRMACLSRSAFWREARLLAPEEIRAGRERLALTQKQFANLLGVGEATVSRWETGAQIQQRAMDRFLRVCLASPAAVDLLRNDFQPSAKGA